MVKCSRNCTFGALKTVHERVKLDWREEERDVPAHLVREFLSRHERSVESCQTITAHLAVVPCSGLAKLLHG
jgi:hypothetical protein